WAAAAVPPARAALIGPFRLLPRPPSARPCSTGKRFAENDYCERCSVVVLRLSLARLRNKNAHVVDERCFWWSANSKQSHAVRGFQDRHILNGGHVVPAAQSGLRNIEFTIRVGSCCADNFRAASQQLAGSRRTRHIRRD